MVAVCQHKIVIIIMHLLKLFIKTQNTPKAGINRTTPKHEVALGPPNYSAWLMLQLNTKLGLHHHHPPHRNFSKGSEPSKRLRLGF